ncbi:MAG: glutathione S-transferase family protein [Alphaproteobacteria bacterium]|nr:glutathione S-transferase family protein [Alphaproteobacteria bacterium]MBL7099778.1 glutathione S-transferase family protein [Alphaproteobacteria bacterium]
MSLIIYEHPLSPYAQKVKISLDEKGVPYEARMPNAIGSGQPDLEFLKANPRGEVPALIDDGFAVFDSTIILEYIEDKWPSPPMLPKSPKDRAVARTIEEVMDTLFEPINWGMGEIRWFRRAEGERARHIEAHAAKQARGTYAWLERHLGDKQWFNGATFGWADLSVVPYINGAIGSGFAPDKGSKLSAWLDRANARPSVRKSAKAAADVLAQMANVAGAVQSGMFKREYRDHRLEWMIRAGGLDVVLEGIKNNNIRFSNEIS